MRIYEQARFRDSVVLRTVAAVKGLETKIEWLASEPGAAQHFPCAATERLAGGAGAVLELDDGTLLCERTKIAEYLDRTDGNPSLTGRTPFERSVIRTMQQRAEVYVAEPAARLLQSPIQRQRGDELVGSDLRARLIARVNEGLHYFDSVLRDRAFVAGSDVSLADLILLTGLHYAVEAKAVPEKAAALRAWHTRMSDLAAVKDHPAGEL